MFTIIKNRATKYQPETATVLVQLSDSERNITIDCYGPDGHRDAGSTVNWSALGSCSTQDAAEYGTALAFAAGIAETLLPAIPYQSNIDFSQEGCSEFEDKAHDKGEEDGTAAGESWVLDMRNGWTSEQAAKVVIGINDIDPEVMDILPRADFSGEMADGLSMSELVEEITGVEFNDLPGEVVGWLPASLVESYEEGFNDGVLAFIEESAREHLGWGAAPIPGTECGCKTGLHCGVHACCKRFMTNEEATTSGN